MEVFASFLGTIGFCLLLYVPRQEYLSCGLVGAGGWLCYLLCKPAFSDYIATFCAILLVAFLSRILAVLRRQPSNVFLIPGFLPMVPGKGIYDTIYSLMLGQIDQGVSKGLYTLKIVGVIVLGIMIVFALPGKLFAPLAKLRLAASQPPDQAPRRETASGGAPSKEPAEIGEAPGEGGPARPDTSPAEEDCRKDESGSFTG